MGKAKNVAKRYQIVLQAKSYSVVTVMVLVDNTHGLLTTTVASESQRERERVQLS